MKTIRRPISILLAVLMVVGMFTMVPISAGAAEGDYYLVGWFNSWNTSDMNVKLVQNPDKQGEYMYLGMTFTEEDPSKNGFKVVSSDDTWYPNDGDNYSIAAGTYDIYFRPDGQGGDGWHYGYIYAEPHYEAHIGDTKYATLAAAIEAAQAGDTIALYDNVTLTESLVIPEGKDFTLDLNGKDITGNVNDKLVKNNGTVVVDDSTATPGHIYNTNIDQQGNAAFVNYGTATIKNGYFGDKNSDMTDANDVNRGAGFQNQGTAVIDGGYFTACDNFTNTAGTGSGYAYAIINYNTLTINDATVYGKNNGNLANNEGTMVVNGGTYTLNKPTKKNVYYSIYNGSADADTTVNAGTFTNNGTKALLYTGEGSTEIKGGTFTGPKIEQSTGAPAISGGTFNKVVPEDYCADGYTPVANGDGTYTVGGPYAAKIGDTGYATLAEAFAAAEDGDTITLLANCTGDGIKVAKAKFANGLTVDFNGHTYTVDGETVGSSGTETIGFQLLKGNKITFQNGTITGNSNTNQTLQRMIQNYSDLTLYNMTVSMVGRYKNQITVSTCNGKTVIKDSKISAPDFTWAGYDDPAEVGAAALAVGTFSSYPSIDVTVEGDSTTINGDVNVSDSNNKKAFSLKLNGGKLNGKINLDENAKAAIDDTESTANVTKAADFDQAAPEGYKWVDDGEGNQTLAAIPYVAKIGDTNYETLKAALDAAGANDTIELLADCTVDETYLVTKDITIDGNNKTVKATDAVEIFKFDTLTATLTVTDCTFDGDNVGLRAATTQGAKGSNNPNAVIDFTNVTVKNFVADNYAGAVYVFGNSKGNFTNCTITGNKVPAAQADLAYAGADIWAGAAATVTIDGGTYGEVFINANARSASKVIVDGDATVAELALEHDRGDASAELKDANITKLQLNDGYVGNATVTEDTVFAVPEGYKVVEGAIVPVKYVAQVGENQYESLEEAIKAISTVTSVYHDKSGLTINKYKANGSIKLLADCAGNGIVIDSGSNLTIDFDGNTYDVTGDLAGSNGTETSGFQLLKDSTVTFENGTITSEKAQMIVQNYSNLTLNNMVLDGTNMAGSGNYVLSNNNGNVVINATTINAREGCIAFDVCRFGKKNTYPSVKVTVTGESKINGNVEIFASNKDPKDGFSLNLESGTMSGKIIVDPTAAAAMESAPDKASVNKKNTFTQDPAAGYKWKDNGDGTSTLVKIPKLFAGNGLALHGDIGVIFYLNPEAAGFSLNQVSSVSVDFACDKYSGTVTEFTKDDATGCIKVAYYVPVAYMASDIIASNVKINNLPAIGTDTYSVQDYALDTINDPNAPAARKTLMKEMLNYGAKAKAVFESQMANPEDAVYEEIPDYTKTTVTVDMIDDAIEGEATDMSTVTPEPGAKFYGSSVIYLSETTLRMVFAIPDGSGSKLPENAYTGHQGKWYHWVDKTNIPAAELHKQQTFTVGNATFNYSALDYAKAVLNSNMDQKNKDLVSAMYLYNQAAIACFA